MSLLLNLLFSPIISKIVLIVNNLLFIMIFIAIISPIIRMVVKRVFKGEETLRLILFPGVFMYTLTRLLSVVILNFDKHEIPKLGTLDVRGETPKWKIIAFRLSPMFNIISLGLLFWMKSMFLNYFGQGSMVFPVTFIWYWLASSMLIYALPTLNDLSTPFRVLNFWIVFSIIWAGLWSIPIIASLGLYSSIVFCIYLILVFLIYKYNSILNDRYNPSNLLNQFLLDI